MTDATWNIARREDGGYNVTYGNVTYQFATHHETPLFCQTLTPPKHPPCRERTINHITHVTQQLSTTALLFVSCSPSHHHATAHFLRGGTNTRLISPTELPAPPKHVILYLTDKEILCGGTPT